MSEINYDDKVDLIVDTGIDDIFKVTASDMNQIKNAVNDNADDIDELNAPEKWVSVGTTAPTDGRRVWFENSVNLINPSLLPLTESGVTISQNSNGDIVLNGTPTITYGYISFIITDYFYLDVGEYTLSVRQKMNGIGVNCGHAGFNGAINLTLSGSERTKTATLSSRNGGDVRVNVRYDVGTLTNFVLNPQLQKGSTAIDYEPYIEKKSIKVDNEDFISMDNLVSVGKKQPEDGKRVWFAKSANLFNKSLTPFYNLNATYTELTTGVKATLTSAGTNKYFAMRLDATKVLGKTLNLSATITPSGTNNGAIRFYFSNNSSLTSIIDGRLTTTGSVQITFPSTIPSGSNGVAIVFSANLNSTTSQVNDYVEYTNVMLQEGSTSYEPYVEPSINVDGDVWYDKSLAIKTRVYPSVTTSDTGYYNLNLLSNEVAVIGIKHNPVESATKIELYSNQLGQVFIRVSVGGVYSSRTIYNLIVYYI